MNGLPWSDMDRLLLISASEQLIGETGSFTTTTPSTEMFTTSRLMLLKNGLGELVLVLQVTAKDEFELQPGPIPKGKGMMTFPHLSGQPCLDQDSSWDKIVVRHRNRTEIIPRIENDLILLLALN